MDQRGSSFLLTAVLIAVFAAVLLAGCTGTPTGGSNQTAALTTQAVNASVAGAGGAAPGAIAPSAETSLPAASGSPAQKAPPTAGSTSGPATVSPTPTKCTTDFTASTTSGAAPLTVTFTATAPCDAQKRHWVFGDGGFTEAEKVTTYTYETPGTYTVKLSEKFYSDDPADTLGFYGSEKEKVGFITVTGSSSATGTATVSPGPTPCQADFTASVTSGPAPLTVTFTRTAPCDSQKQTWNFGVPGSGIEGGPVETYTYEAPGTYTVSLTEKFYTDDNIEGFYADTEEKVGFITVTGSAPATGTATVTGTQDPMNCTADFSATPTTGNAPLTVTFTTWNTCSPIWQHMWVFGDGSETLTVEGTVNTVTHTYTQPGTYSVILTDDDHYLESGEYKANYITVTGTAPVSPTPTKCTTDFTASKTSGAAPLTVTFTATAPCDVQKRHWVFGDGGFSEGGKVETYTYETPGTYTVKLSEKFYSDDPADTLGFYGGEKEKVDYIHVTKGLVVNPSLHITNLPTLKVTPKITLVKPGITLPKEKVVVIDPIGPVSRDIGALQK